MTFALAIASVYVGQLGLKALLALRYTWRARSRMNAGTEEDVSIVQPILSGDPALADTLESNLRTLPGVNFVWLVDTDDPIGIATCESLVARHPGNSISMLRCDPPPQGMNPKVRKLAVALPAFTTRSFVVLDDDSRLSVPGLRALLQGLNDGAALATGLPKYHPGVGHYSSWLAEFVNSAAVLTYLPPLSFAGPLSIHGMCYAMRTEEARRLDVFHTIGHSLTDDLALAVQLRRRGLRIHQTVEPHDIATAVPSFVTLLHILHRWFVFTRLLLEEHSLGIRLLIGLTYGIPPLLLWILMGVAGFSTGNALVLIITLGARALLLWTVKRKILGPPVAQLLVVSILLELAQPLLLVAAWLRTTIQWRTRTIRVRSVSEFEYV